MRATLWKPAGSDAELRVYVDNPRTGAPIADATVTVSIVERANRSNVLASDLALDPVAAVAGDDESGAGWFGAIITADLLPEEKAPTWYLLDVVSVKNGRRSTAEIELYDAKDRRAGP